MIGEFCSLSNYEYVDILYVYVKELTVCEGTSLLLSVACTGYGLYVTLSVSNLRAEESSRGLMSSMRKAPRLARFVPNTRKNATLSASALVCRVSSVD